MMIKDLTVGSGVSKKKDGTDRALAYMQVLLASLGFCAGKYTI
jgi:hypothetical protein